MRSSFLPLFVLLLSATFSGCLSPAARSAAPGGVGGGDSTTVSSHETVPDAGAGIGIGGSGATTSPPVIADGGGILPPRPDGERIGEDTAFVALYGPDFSQTLSPSESGGLTQPPDGRLDLPLRVQRMQGSLEGGFEAVDIEPNLQIRLIRVYSDTEGRLRYSHCDAMSSAVKPLGYNALFTGLDVSASGQIQVFVVNPLPPGRAPTADFSSACVNFPDETINDTSFIANLILGQDFRFVGTFQLMFFL